ncbi:hypothetical protein BT96DRAFT_980789 [Gymnopus androsaceus JB14]|uniref:Uncharacterized protein n=1 Tax=Gymnopus androsaceus JB14 TaxID=1447944 RepID=A0A6A4GUS4_9AGAR|nr:hypothetical protein BT96DRAFT_980789 [Gymnopus androsaceus JB14]
MVTQAHTIYAGLFVENQDNPRIHSNPTDQVIVDLQPSRMNVKTLPYYSLVNLAPTNVLVHTHVGLANNKNFIGPFPYSMVEQMRGYTEQGREHILLSVRKYETLELWQLNVWNQEFISSDTSFSTYQSNNITAWGSFESVEALSKITILTASCTLQGSKVRENVNKGFAQIGW